MTDTVVGATNVTDNENQDFSQPPVYDWSVAEFQTESGESIRIIFPDTDKPLFDDR